MADVAARAGVSAATVARALYDNGYVSAEKRAVIQAALGETGYRPNIVARALRTARSFTMGLVVSESRLNGFHPSVAREVQLEALRHGYTVLTLNNNGSAAIEDAGVKRFLDHHVDAVLFCAAMNPANVRLTASLGIPTVQIEREVEHVGTLVAVDPRPGMTAAIRHLKDLGHVRVAYIGPSFTPGECVHPDRSAIEAGRLACFTEAMAAAALSVNPELILLAPYIAPRGERQPGHTRMSALLAAPRRPTAVVTGADQLAAGALQAIHDAGLRVPDDMSLIGYDDVMAEILTPPLTCIAQPIEDLGRAAVRAALDAMQDGAVTGTVHTSRTDFVVRQSTASPHQGRRPRILPP